MSTLDQKRINRGNLFKRFGIILIALALLGLTFTLYPVVVEEIKYKNLTIEETSFDVTPVKIEERKTIVAVDKDFSVVIPKIGANVKIIPNVDPYNSKEYQKELTKGIAHAKGTSFPNELGNTFLFAHSSNNFYNASRYNAVFYLLSKLEVGDLFYIVYNEVVYKYEIAETRVVEKEQMEYMKGNPRMNTATLMTCWPPGTTLKRHVVVGKLLNN